MTKKKTPYVYKIGERVFIRSGDYYGRYGTVVQNQNPDPSDYSMYLT